MFGGSYHLLRRRWVRRLVVVAAALVALGAVHNATAMAAGSTPFSSSVVAAGATVTNDITTSGADSLTLLYDWRTCGDALCTGDATFKLWPFRANGSTVQAQIELPRASETLEDCTGGGGDTCQMMRTYDLRGVEKVRLVVVNNQGGATVTVTVTAFTKRAQPVSVEGTLSTLETGIVRVKGDSTVGAERVHVECSNCSGGGGGKQMVEFSQDPGENVIAMDTVGENQMGLSWAGIWFVGGLIIVALIAPAFHRAFPWGRAGGIT